MEDPEFVKAFLFYSEALLAVFLPFLGILPMVVGMETHVSGGRREHHVLQLPHESERERCPSFIFSGE